jgi:Bacterial type III secretion protein (HrpB4)
MNGYDGTDDRFPAGYEDQNGEQSVFAEGGKGEAAAQRGPVANSLAGETPAAVAARLTEHHRHRRTLFEWMHPLRLAGLPYANRLRGAGAAEKAALAEAFLDQLGMPAPPLASFNAPGAALAVLPARECITVLRLRALIERAEEVRSWIDRARRQRLIDWIGPRGVQLLLGQRRALSGDSALASAAPRAPRATRATRATLGAADADALAWLGFRLFERECGWGQDGPLAIVQLAMPAEAASASPSAVPAARGWNPSLSIVSQLPDLFPEWSW